MTNRLQYLFTAYINRSINPAERQELWELVNQPEHAEDVKAAIGYAMENSGNDYNIPGELAEKIFNHVISGDRYNNDLRDDTFPVVHRVHFLKTSWFRYAAAIIIIVGGVAVWKEISRSARNDGAVVTTVSKSEDIAPGTNKAILTIGNNRPMDLSSSKTGIAVSNAITYTDGEKIANAGELLTLATPRGGQYQAVLPDGSKVWLNAASSIQFPSKFSGTERRVEITGEAYIEVAKNSRQPFYVHTRKTDIQVLGTSFDINAYSDEGSVKTTLVEGSVKIKAGDKESILKPGQQAEVTNNLQVTIQSADIDQVLAWKNGMFQFKEASIQDVMRQLERWYDIEIVYEGQLKPQHFNGGISRNVELSKVIKMLEATDAFHFRLEGKKVYVIP